MTLHALLVSLALNAGSPGPAPEPLKVGVVSVLGEKTAQGNSNDISEYLKKALKRDVSPVVYPTYDELANAVVHKRVDFAWMPPLQGLVAHMGGATLAVKLLRHGSASYRSVVFTRADSKLGKLEDVQGAKVGWVDRNSSTGYLFPLATIARANLTPAKMFSDQKFLGNHEAVCKAVQDKQVDLGATFTNEANPGKDVSGLEVSGCASVAKSGFKVLAVSEPVPNDVFVLRDGLEPPTRDALTQVVLDLPKSPEGQALLKQVFKADGLAPVQEADFVPVQHALDAAAKMESGH